MTVESPTAKEDLQREIDRLRAELEESHGQQIVQLKEELQDQHRMEMDRAHRELTQLRSDKEQLNRQVCVHMLALYSKHVWRRCLLKEIKNF